MARAKKFADPVTFQVRCERSTLEQLDALAKSQGVDRNDLVITRLASVREAVAAVNHPSETPKQSGETQSPISNCPHKYRVRKGEKSVCPACGDSR